VIGEVRIRVPKNTWYYLPRKIGLLRSPWVSRSKFRLVESRWRTRYPGEHARFPSPKLSATTVALREPDDKPRAGPAGWHDRRSGRHNRAKDAGRRSTLPITT
jgi:hypothetical protein